MIFEILEKRAPETKGANKLTPREQEVLKLLAHGKTNREIAGELHVAEVTVRFHLRNIYSKIEVCTRTAAVRWAMQHGLGD